MAIIHSSLDNLEAQPLDEKSQTYQQRAKEGALRLGNILTAMSEAKRVEESKTDTAHLGLGLYIVQLIVSFHGGSIIASNRSDNSGVSFSIALPMG